MFEVIGMATVIVIAIAVFISVIKNGVNYTNNNDSFMFTFFDFGIIIARSEKSKKQLNSFRKTTGKTLFINAPMWFNLHVYNFGVIK